MSLLLIDGFDDGLTGFKWDGASGTALANVTTSGPRTGTHRIGFDTGGGPYLFKDLGADAHATVIVGLAMQTSLINGSVADVYFGADAGATSHIQVRRNSNGGFDVYRGGTWGQGLGTLIGSSTNWVLVAQWNYVEIKVVLHDTTGSVVIRVNGAQVFSFTGDTKNAGTEAVISRVLLGTTNSGTYSGFQADDVYIANGAGSVNTDFLGDIRVMTHFPNGNGNYSQLLGSDGNQTDNYLLVDESPAPNTTDYVSSATAGQIDTYHVGDSAAGTIKGVAVRAYAAKSDAGDRSLRTQTRVGGVNYPGADRVLSTSWAGYSTMHEVNPNTGALWTVTAFNGAEFGVEVR